MPISCYSTKSVIEIIMAVIMLSIIILVFIRSFLDRKGIVTIKKADGAITTKENKVGGIGARSIQFICVGLIIPSIIILALENILSGETVATIVGGLIGYVLSGISNYDKNKED